MKHQTESLELIGKTEKLKVSRQWAALGLNHIGSWWPLVYNLTNNYLTFSA